MDAWLDLHEAVLRGPFKLAEALLDVFHRHASRQFEVEHVDGRVLRHRRRVEHARQETTDAGDTGISESLLPVEVNEVCLELPLVQAGLPEVPASNESRRGCVTPRSDP